MGLINIDVKVKLFCGMTNLCPKVIRKCYWQLIVDSLLRNRKNNCVSSIKIDYIITYRFV